MGRQGSSSPGPGAVVDGKFRVVRELGRGGMGVVLEATHLALSEPVALKVLRPELAEDASRLARLVREARAMAKVRSEHVARILDLSTRPPLPYLVIELLDGEDLRKRLVRVGPLAVEEAVDLMLQACEALAAAHAVGVVHRDLKPSNLFITSGVDGLHLKVLDFGVAKILSEDDDVTRTSDVVGSTRYMAPEQLRASRHVTARADVWSLAVTLHEALCGAGPFDRPSQAETVAAILREAPSRADSSNPEVPAPLAEAIARALEKDPASRTESVRELARALAPFGGPHATRRLAAILRIGMVAAADDDDSTVAPALRAPATRTSASDVRPVVGTPVPRPASGALRKTAPAAVVLTLGALAVAAARLAPADEAVTPPSSSPAATSSAHDVPPPVPATAASAPPATPVAAPLSASAHVAPRASASTTSKPRGAERGPRRVDLLPLSTGPAWQPPPLPHADPGCPDPSCSRL